MKPKPIKCTQKQAGDTKYRRVEKCFFPKEIALPEEMLKQIKRKFSYNDVDLFGRVAAQRFWVYVLKKMHSCLIDRLNLNDNFMPTMLINIVHIRFDKLMGLHIADNNIENIEVISLLQMPNLQDLFIYYNKIVTLKSFRKCVLPRLNQIRINANEILELQCISEFKGDKLQRMRLESHQSNRIQCEDLSIGVKLQCTLKYLQLKQQRINLGRQKIMLNRCYSYKLIYK